MLFACGSVGAQEIQFFRIGTGAVGETRFALGGLIANVISNPPGSRDCAKGGSCGVPGLIAVAQSTAGSVANVAALADHRLESALVQADIAFWAYRGEGLLHGKPPMVGLRSIAELYSEDYHLVARKGAGIASVRDLRHKRVAIGEEGSGSRSHALFLLKAYGLSEKDISPVVLAPGAAADALSAGTIDAALFIDAPPSHLVADLAQHSDVILVPIHGPEIEALRKASPFLRIGVIPAGTYVGEVAAVPTLEVGVVLLVAADLPDALVFALTQALWQPASQKLLAEALPGGKSFHLAAAGEDLGLPLHPGAATFFAQQPKTP